MTDTHDGPRRSRVHVLVPGFWVGAWIWRPVTEALRARGHTVYPVTLTGLGEREHLATPDVDLETHITDVINLLRFEDLHDVVLVGHSYGGLVVTGVADRMPELVRQLVYVDTGPLPDGAANADFAGPEERAHQEALVAAGDGWRLPPPPWAEMASDVDGIGPGTVALLEERSVPQPWRTAVTPVRLHGAWEKVPRLGVLSSFTEAQTRAMAGTAPLFRHMAGDGWRFVELPTWHWPMLSRPDELTEILAASASA
jgi:pimeloyl-ACP methyl ester carboxylesterase